MIRTIFVAGGVLAGTLVPGLAQRFAVPMDQLIGINSRASDPIQFLRHFDYVREYHQWSDDVGDSPTNIATCPEDFNPQAFPGYMRYRFNPSFSGAGLIRYDDFYTELYQKAVPVLKGIAPLMRGYTTYPLWVPQLLEQKPFCLTGYYQWWDQTSSPPLWTLPASQANPDQYRSHALWATLMAARYGSKRYSQNSAYYTQFLQPHYVTEGWHSVFDDLVEAAPGRTGMAAIRYIECNNEPEKSWYDRPVDIADGDGQTLWQMTAHQYAAQLSAAYDGHGRSDFFRIPGDTSWLGIKNADPELQVIFGGLADFRGKYVEDVMEWCRTYRLPGVGSFFRGPVLPFDVLNFHHYSTMFSVNDWSGNNTLSRRYEDITAAPIYGRAISPERDDLRGEILYTAQRLEQAEPELVNKEIWITEFGFDSGGPLSAVRVPTISGQDGQKTQAQWTVRSLLEIASTQRVSKAMLYELRDEPGLYGSHFGYSGLVTADYRPKRSWYYVQTLRRALRGYYFDPETPDGALISPDVVQVASGDVDAQDSRVYKFTRGGDDNIYAIWSPTTAGKTYVAGLIFQPGIQFSQASLITFEEMNEGGRWSDWSAHVTVEKDGRIRVADLPVSETPLFLALHRNRHDDPPPPLAGLTAAPICCNAVRLSWNPDPAHHSYRVYYRQQAATDPPLPFDFTRADLKLHDHALGGAAGFTIVSGLQAGQPYWFYVIPVDEKGLLPADWSTAPALVGATPADCASGSLACMLEIQPGQVTLGAGQPAPWNVLEMLSANYQANSCQETAPQATSWNNWDNWDWATNDPLATAITIDLQQTQVIHTISLLDSYGKGHVRFEYKNCLCDQWQPLATVELNVDFDRWMYVSGLAPAPVRYLRVTRLNPDAKIRKLFFCASPASCDPGAQGFQPGPMTGLETGTVGTHSARLHWPAVPFHPGQPALGNVADYRIRYSSEWDVTGALIHAREKRVNFSPWEKDLSAEVTGLEPATTYRAQVRPEAGQPDCGAVQPGQWIEFTTVDPQESNGSDRAVRTTPPAAGLRVQPNPASGQVLVQSAAAGHTRLKVVEPATGKIIREMPVEATLSSWQLDVGQWLPGLYLLRLEGPGLTGETARLVVVR